jgi:hypothetical protein
MQTAEQHHEMEILQFMGSEFELYTDITKLGFQVDYRIP